MTLRACADRHHVATRWAGTLPVEIGWRFAVAPICQGRFPTDPLSSCRTHQALGADVPRLRGIRGSAVSVTIASGSRAASAPADRA